MEIEEVVLSQSKLETGKIGRERWDCGTFGSCFSKGAIMASKGTYRVRATLPYEAKYEGKWWIASCSLLKSVGQGRTERSALNSLKDAIVLKVQVGLQKENLETTLMEYGFHPLRAGDRIIWGVPGSHQDSPRLEIRANLRVRKPKEEALPKVEPISNDLPWVISGYYREPSSRHSRAS
jgi:predicted RNase H-like HicB family nuclease